MAMIDLSKFLDYPMWFKMAWVIWIVLTLSLGASSLFVRPALKTANDTTKKQRITTSTKTLLDLFKNDFNNLLRGGQDFTLSNKDIGQITIKSQAYLDFTSQTIFIGFYIPNTPHTYTICVYLSNNYNKALDITKNIMAEETSTGLQPVNTNELKFSGRVFLYHETPLLEEQRRELFALYKSKGLAPQFRDYQYVLEINKARS